jgi:hypothetical protein
MARIMAAPGSGGKVVPVSGNKKKKFGPVKGAIGSATRKKEYDARGWKYDKTIKANPQVTAFDSKLKIGRDVVKTSKKTGVKTKAESNTAKKNSILGKPGSTGKNSNKTEKIVIQKRKAITKKSIRQDKRTVAKKARVTKKVERLENRKARVDLKGKQATKAGKTGANSKARDLVARKARLQKRINKKTK